MKRVNTVRWVTAVAALAVVVTGCSSGSTPTAPATAEGPATLRFAWWGNATRAQTTQSIVDAFMAENPDIKVIAEPGEFSGYFDKLATQVAANDAPDVITLGGAYLPEYTKRKVLLDLGTVSAQFPTTDIDQGALDNGTVGGVRYGATTGVNALAVLVNPKVFADAGVPLPDDETWTWDDYAATAKQVQAASGEGIYGSAGGLTHDSLDAWARQRGEMLYTAEGKLGLTKQTLSDYFAYSKALVDAKAAPPAAIITEQVGVSIEQSLVATNKAAMAVTWSNYLTPGSKAAGTDLKLLKLPGESAGKPGIWLQSSQFFTISAKTKHPQAAAKLVSYLLNSPEAGTKVLNDRGVPTNAKVRAAIAPSLSPTGQAEVAYIDRIGSLTLQPTFIGPPGSTQVTDITNRAMSDVLFGKSSPDQAADRWISETQSAIS